MFQKWTIVEWGMLGMLIFLVVLVVVGQLNVQEKMSAPKKKGMDTVILKK